MLIIDEDSIVTKIHDEIVVQGDMPPQCLSPEELAQALVDLGYNAVNTKSGRMSSAMKNAEFGFRYGRSDTLPALNPRPTDAEIQKLNKDYEGHYLHISADASAEPVFPIHDNEEPIRLKFNGVFKHVIHEKQSIPTGTGTGDTESEGS